MFDCVQNKETKLVEGVSGGEGRRGVGVDKDGRARMSEVLRTVETDIFNLSRLRGIRR